jgi:hypothetical protein
LPDYFSLVNRAFKYHTKPELYKGLLDRAFFVMGINPKISLASYADLYMEEACCLEEDTGGQESVALPEKSSLCLRVEITKKFCYEASGVT